MAKSQNANKIDNDNSPAMITLADFVQNPYDKDNNPTGIKIETLSAVDQTTAKLVLASIESAKKQGVLDEQKRVEMDREARLTEIRLNALNRDFWSVKGENSLYHHWNVALNGMIQTTLPIFMLPSGIPWSFFVAPEFEKNVMAKGKDGKTIPAIPSFKDISKRLIVRQFGNFWIDFRVTLHHGVKPIEKKRGRKAVVIPEVAQKK